MRILCLHGVGSSGRICESQFGPFLKVVDPSYDFVFVDGPVPSDRGPGIGPDLDGPFFSHTTGYSPQEMAEAVHHLDATIDELGPFDGVLGFSQGAALTLSYMHQRQSRGQPVPFRFFLSFSSVIPCAADSGYCDELITSLRAHQMDVGTATSAVDPALTKDERLFNELLQRTVVAAKKNNALLPDYDMNVYTVGDSDAAPRVMHQQWLKEKIRIPTVHVSGKRDHDFMLAMSSTAQGLLDNKLTKKLEHSGGHHPPMKPVEVKAIARAMEWAIQQSDRISISVL